MPIRRSIHRWVGALIFASTAVAAVARDDGRNEDFRPQAYSNHVLVSNGAVPADFTDANLKNGWGVAFNPQGFVWVVDNGTGKSTLYDGTGKPQSLVVTIPGVGGEGGAPTGIVSSGGSDFVVSATNAAGATVSGPSRFIFVTEDGTIAGWAPNVNLTNAISVPVPATNANYKGVALGGDGTTHLLYAADFRNGRVDVFDGAFKPVMKAGAFMDPNLPSGYAPFGIQAINGDIYVTYAKQDAAGDDEIAGPGLGFIDVFSPEGMLLGRFASRGALNAPWGLALAPLSFGDFGGALLVGNFGDGTINAYSPRTGRWLGTLRDQRQRKLRVDGLWGLQFGNGVAAQKTNSLYYAAGPDDEQNGTYGVIEPVKRKH
jgi:uncharacterized protein (TIGR03118 family)